MCAREGQKLCRVTRQRLFLCRLIDIQRDVVGFSDSVHWKSVCHSCIRALIADSLFVCIFVYWSGRHILCLRLTFSERDAAPLCPVVRVLSFLAPVFELPALIYCNVLRVGTIEFGKSCCHGRCWLTLKSRRTAHHAIYLQLQNYFINHPTCYESSLPTNSFVSKRRQSSHSLSSSPNRNPTHNGRED